MTRGIDVSSWQGKIDWQAVKASGVDFAMIRASFATRTDSHFELNYEGAKAAGVNVGAYHYLYSNTIPDAEREAGHFLAATAGKRFEYPLALDYEDAALAGLSVTNGTSLANYFAGIIGNAGHYCVLYCNKNWLTTRLDMKSLVTDIWLAQWTYDEVKPMWTGAFGIWQNSNRGRVPGIAVDVDTNISYRDYPSILKSKGLCGWGTPGAAPPPPEPPPDAGYKARYEALCAELAALNVKYGG